MTTMTQQQLPLAIEPPVTTGRQLYHYQQKAYDYFEPLDKIANFMQMRLGKTLVTIKWALSKNVKRHLVVCPLSVVPVWKKELELEGIQPKVLSVKTYRLIKDMLPYLEGWFIINYEVITFTDILPDPDAPIETSDTARNKILFDLIILDEATKIRDPKTKITKALCEKTTQVPFKAILSGTPAPEGLLDYFNQFKFLFGYMYDGHYNSWYRFKNSLFRHAGLNKYEPVYGVKQKLIDWVSKHSYVLSRNQVHIGSKKIYQQRYCDLDDAAQDEYNSFEKNWINNDFDTKWAIVAFNYMHQMSGGFPYGKAFRSHHKVKELINLAKNELRDEKIVIWFRYVNEIKECFDRCSEFASCEMIYGDTPVFKRQSIANDFNDAQNPLRLLFCQIKTASMGIDLSGADTVIYYSNTFSGLDRLQSEDRVIHPDKKTQILYIDLVTNNTIDEDLYSIIEMKKKNQDEVLLKIYESMRQRHGY